MSYCFLTPPAMWALKCAQVGTMTSKCRLTQISIFNTLPGKMPISPTSPRQTAPSSGNEDLCFSTRGVTGPGHTRCAFLPLSACDTAVSGEPAKSAGILKPGNTRSAGSHKELTHYLNFNLLTMPPKQFLVEKSYKS